MISLASKSNWSIYHLNVKSTFLNYPLGEEVFITQSPGFEQKRKEKYVYKLNKALYSLKQTPRCWNKRLTHFL